MKHSTVTTRLQLIETHEQNIHYSQKEYTHIGFTSSSPINILQNVEAFCKKHTIKYIQKQWSDAEYYFDCPEIFANFVVEIMDTSILE